MARYKLVTLTGRQRPYCDWCHRRKVSDVPAPHSYQLCNRCYVAHHDYHACPCHGCKECDE